jgi:hypothetical protein
MRTLQGLEARKEKRRLRNQRGRARKEVVRVERTKDEPIRGEWRGKFIGTLTWQDRLSGKILSFDFRLSQKRVNSFAVAINGQPWKKQIGWSRTLAALRKKLPRFSLHA